MFEFWFWWLIDLPLLVLNLVWWRVAVRLLKSRVWQVLVSLFMVGQTLACVSSMSGLDWVARSPKPVLVAVIVWHRFGVALALGILLLLGIVRARAWLIRRRKGPATAPAGVNTQTRREFIGACAALTPSLFTIGLTGVALAQLNRFRVRRFTLSIPTLPRALDGVTIAHVSDMHVGRLTSGRVLREVVNTTNALRADLVLLTGDLIHRNLADLSEAIALVQAMEGRSGRWMVEGNHDLFENGAEFQRRVKAAGVPLLLDESAITQVRGHPVQLFGLRWLTEHDRLPGLQLRGLMKQRQPDAFPILLTHHPHTFDVAVRVDLPLTLAGHTHGGQWMLSPDRGVGSVLFRYWSGLYRSGRSQLIVSNGVGNMHPLRINAPAEIVHLTLRCAETEG